MLVDIVGHSLCAALDFVLIIIRIVERHDDDLAVAIGVDLLEAPT
jgi:hypothetical protein